MYWANRANVRLCCDRLSIISTIKYPSMRMSFFAGVKGCVNCHETTPVHKQCILMR